MTDDVFRTDLSLPAHGHSLEDEREDDKGVRMLRVMREFNASEFNVTGILLDDQPLLVVKVDREFFQGEEPLL